MILAVYFEWMKQNLRKSLLGAALWLWAGAAASAMDVSKPLAERPSNAAPAGSPAVKPVVLNLKPMALGASGVLAPAKAASALPLPAAALAAPRTSEKTPQVPAGVSGIESLDAPIQEIHKAAGEEAAGGEGAVERSLKHIFDAEKPSPENGTLSPVNKAPAAPAANENIVVVHAPRKKTVSAMGYRLYHAAPTGFEAHPAHDEEFSVEFFTGKEDAGLGLLKRRIGVFNALVEDNFAALELISKNSGHMTAKVARLIYAKVGAMVSGYRELGGMTAAGSFLLAHDKLGLELEKHIGGLGEQEMIPAKAFEMIVPMEKESLHKYINLIHQGALQEIGRAASSYGANLYLKFEKKGDDQLVKLMDVSEKPTVSQGRILSPALKALAEALRGIHDTPTGSLILQDHQSWGHFKLGSHSAEVYASFLPPDEGGMIRIRYMEYAKQEPNRARLYYIEKVLGNLGFAVKAENQFLTAVIDKDHKAQTVDEMMETYRLVILAFHATKGLDFALPDIMRESIRGVDDWAEIAAAEGGLPFFAHNRDREMLYGYGKYRTQNLKREDLRVALNRTLQRLGLPEIPARARLGQHSIDKFFNRPIEEAIARGQLRISRDGEAVVNSSYDPLSLLAYQATVRGVDSARMAQALGELDPELFKFEALGTVGEFSAQRAQRKLDSGDWLVLHVLRDPRTNQIAFARAERGSLDAIPELLSSQSVFRLLGRQGIAVSAFEPGASPAGLEIYAKQLASPPEVARVSGFLFSGLAVSPGQGRAITARVTYDKAKAALGGSIFIAAYTTPDDLAAIKNARAVLTTSGGALSHAAITTRELGVAAVILQQASWSGGAAALEAAVYGKPRQTHGVFARDIESRRTVLLREGDVVRVDPEAGTLEVFAPEKQEAALMAAEDFEARAKILEEAKAGPRKILTGEFLQKKKPSGIERSETALPLSAISDADAPWVGGKAAKLGEIQKVVRAAGAFVPDAAVLTIHAYRKFLKNAGIESEIERVGGDSRLSLEERSAKIRRLILDAPLNAYEGVGLEIVRAVHARDLTHTPLAVRSSAVDEDGEDAAFAGAGDTHLYVDNAGLIKHVKQVWASLWNARALFYRRAKGLSLALLNQAVVIQAMAAADVSGVAFTRDPVTGQSGRLIVNAAFGMGEGVVSGRVSPDQYTLDKDNGREVLAAIIADKKLEIVRAPDGKGVIEKRVAAERRRARSLSPEQLRKLNAVAVALENHFGYGLDIEFSFAGRDLFILQARPITSAISARGPPL